MAKKAKKKKEEKITEEVKTTVKFFTKQNVDEDEGTVTAVISTDAIDRDNEVLSPKGAILDNFLKNPVVLWVHNSFGMPVGKALWIKRGRKKITAKVKFAKTDLGQEVFEMFKGGFLNAFSVGFIVKKSHSPTPDEIKKKPELAEAWRIFDEWELLEFSVVPVPANQEALATAVKQKTLTISDTTLEDMDMDVEEIFLTEDEQKKVDEEEKEEKEVDTDEEKDIVEEDVEEKVVEDGDIELVDGDASKGICSVCKKDNKELRMGMCFDCFSKEDVEEKEEGIEVTPVDIDVKIVDDSIEVTPVEEEIEVTPFVDVKEIISEEIKLAKGIVYN